MLNGDRFLEKVFYIHFTLGIDVEVTCWHFRSILTTVDVFGKVVELVTYYKIYYFVNLPLRKAKVFESMFDYGGPLVSSLCI